MAGPLNSGLINFLHKALSRKDHLLLVILMVAGLMGYLFASLQLSSNYSVLASYSTSLNGRTDAEKRNILRAASRIDGIILQPDDSFSFNDVVGDRLISLGYETAPSFWGRGTKDIAGGGICQLSSTLYNAVLLADLKILERVPHQHLVSSVGPGRDATVVYGQADLRFRNTYPFPIMLKVDEIGERLTVKILAPHSIKKEVEILAEIEEKIPPPLQKGREAEKPQAGKAGCKVKVWRLVTEGGKTKKELISVDRYEPIPSIVP